MKKSFEDVVSDHLLSLAKKHNLLVQAVLELEIRVDELTEAHNSLSVDVEQLGDEL